MTFLLYLISYSIVFYIGRKYAECMTCIPLISHLQKSIEIVERLQDNNLKYQDYYTERLEDLDEAVKYYYRKENV